MAAVSAESVTAARAASIPSTGLWDEAHLVERLVRAGLAPQRIEAPRPSTPWMKTSALIFGVGGGELFVWIYPDSTRRKAVVAEIDTLFVAPKGESSPFGEPRIWIEQNNLAAVLIGGTDRHQERIVLALQAGLPVTPPDPKP